MEKYCPNCNKQNPSEAMFCRNCAVSLTLEGGTPRADANQAYYAYQRGNPNAAGGGPVAGNYIQPSAGPSGRAIASLVLTVCGLILCCGGFTSIPGAILGWLEISAIREGRSSPKGMMMAQIGLWGGILVTIVMTGFTVICLFMMMIGGAGGAY